MYVHWTSWLGRSKYGSRDLAENWARCEAGELENWRRCGNSPCDHVRILHAEPGGQHASVGATQRNHWTLSFAAFHNWIQFVQQCGIVGQRLFGCEIPEMGGRVKWLVAKRQRMSIISVFGEYNQGTQFRGVFPHKTSVLGKQFDVAFIARVEEDWPISIMRIGVIYEVTICYSRINGRCYINLFLWYIQIYKIHFPT